VSHAQELRVRGNGLEHHVLEWARDGSGAAARPVFLLHGFLDAAATWDRVAPHLAARGHRVLAPDLRGFGEGPRAPAGSYYHFVDYVADVADLVEALAPGGPVSVVGHSMGGTVAVLYAGAFPERVSRLATLEGLGPPDNPFEVGPARMRGWIEDVRRARTREVKAMTSDDARRRLGASHPRVPADLLDDRLHHLVRPAAGGFVWRHDPLHRTRSPVPFFAQLFAAFAREVACPTLFVSGGPLGYHPPDEEERLAAFRDLARAEIAGAGHMMHWTEPEALAAEIARFLEG